MKRLKLMVDPQGVDREAWKKAFGLAMKLSEHGSLGWSAGSGQKVLSIPLSAKEYYPALKATPEGRFWRANCDLENSTEWDAFLLPEDFPVFDEVFFPASGDPIKALVNRVVDPKPQPRAFTLWDGMVDGKSAFQHLLAIGMVLQHFCPKAVLVVGDLSEETSLAAQALISNVTGMEVALPIQFDLNGLCRRVQSLGFEDPAREVSVLLALYQGELNADVGDDLSKVYSEQERMTGIQMLEGDIGATETWVRLGYDVSALPRLLRLTDPEILDYLLESRCLPDDERDYWFGQLLRLAKRTKRNVLELYQILLLNDGLELLHTCFELLRAVKEVFQVETLVTAMTDRGWL